MLHKEAVWKEVERFNIFYDKNAVIYGIKDNLSSVLELMGKKINTEKSPAIASFMLRHAAFIYVSQLYMLTKYRLVWKGNLKNVGLIDAEFNGRWTPKWTFQEGHWVSLESEEQVYSALQKLLCLECRSLVKAVAEMTKSPQLVLWENIWGYVIWMYVQLFNESADISMRARKDLRHLLEDSTWEGFERQSPFTKFLNGQSPEESMANYARVTCCLYYLIPGNNQCSYCPRQSNKECLL